MLDLLYSYGVQTPHSSCIQVVVNILLAVFSLESRAAAGSTAGPTTEVMSPTQNWARLYRVQRRTRHVRRLAACLPNYTKGWSSLNRGMDARIKTKKSIADEHNSPECARDMTAKVEMAEKHLDKAHRVFRIIKSMVQIAYKFLALIVQLVMYMFQAGTKMGSFFYFAKTVFKAGQVAIMLFGSYNAMKLGAELLPAPTNKGDRLTMG